MKAQSVYRQGLCAIALAIASVPASSRPQAAAYSIERYSISAGGMTLANRCFRLSGAIGQVVPGYSNSAEYSLYAGFWAGLAGRSADEIFFAGFEEC